MNVALDVVVKDFITELASQVQGLTQMMHGQCDLGEKQLSTQAASPTVLIRKVKERLDYP